jgi:hypothetical protein
MNEAELTLLRAPQPRNEGTGELMTLVRQSVARRDTGLLILGGFPGSGERRQLLIAALAATAAAGPAAVVDPAAHVDAADDDPQGEASDHRIGVTRFPDGPLPRFASAVTAREHGYRRLVIDSEGPLDGAEWSAGVPPAGAVCWIAGVTGIDARQAFESLTPADWPALEGLMGILTCGRLPGTRAPLTLWDAFVATHRPIYRSAYDSASEALSLGRQRHWEAQALEHLDAGRVAPGTLRQHLLAWGVLEPGESAGMPPTEREDKLRVGLRIWLQEHLLLRRRPAAPTHGYH